MSQKFGIRRVAVIAVVTAMVGVNAHSAMAGTMSDAMSRPDVSQQGKTTRISDLVARAAPPGQVHRLGLDQTTMTPNGKQKFKVGSAPGSGITVARGDGSNDFSLSLPNAGSLSHAHTAADGTVVYQDSKGKTDVAVQAQSNGIRIQTVTADSKSPKSFAYGLDVRTRAVLNSDGSADLLKDHGHALVTVGHLDAPWAKDANGKSVPTRYSVSSSAITQTITPDASTAYPVVADPKVTSTWWNTTIYFNRNETRLAGFGAGTAGTVASWVPTPYTVVVGRIVQLYGATFGLYYLLGECAKLVFVPINSTPAPLKYSGAEAGGYCR